MAQELLYEDFDVRVVRDRELDRIVATNKLRESMSIAMGFSKEDSVEDRGGHDLEVIFHLNGKTGKFRIGWATLLELAFHEAPHICDVQIR